MHRQEGAGPIDFEKLIDLERREFLWEATALYRLSDFSDCFSFHAYHPRITGLLTITSCGS
jgi:hypothetical protein